MSKTAKSSPPKPNVLKGSRNRAHNFEAFVIPIQLTIKGRKCTLAFASLSSWQSIQNVFFLTDAECSKNSKKNEEIWIFHLGFRVPKKKIAKMSKFWHLNTAPFFRIWEHYMMPNRPCKQHIPFGKSLGKTIMTPRFHTWAGRDIKVWKNLGVGKRRNFVLPEKSKKKE